MANKEYRIPFVGLKIGVHEFQFDITDAFFEMFEYSLILKGKVDVQLRLEKKETMMIGDFHIEGRVEAECDRCSDPVEVKVKGDYQLIYKFDTEASEDENLITVFPEEFEIDVQNSILEFITVSLPSRNLHKEGECNQEMIDILSEYILYSEDGTEVEEPSEDEIDPRWAALKNLKKDNNDLENK